MNKRQKAAREEARKTGSEDADVTRFSELTLLIVQCCWCTSCVIIATNPELFPPLPVLQLNTLKSYRHWYIYENGGVTVDSIMREEKQSGNGARGSLQLLWKRVRRLTKRHLSDDRWRHLEPITGTVRWTSLTELYCYEWSCWLKDCWRQELAECDANSPSVAAERHT